MCVNIRVHQAAANKNKILHPDKKSKKHKCFSHSLLQQHKTDEPIKKHSVKTIDMLNWMKNSRPGKLIVGAKMCVESDVQAEHTQVIHLKSKTTTEPMI